VCLARAFTCFALGFALMFAAAACVLLRPQDAAR